jgi:hypothetical protein
MERSRPGCASFTSDVIACFRSAAICLADFHDGVKHGWTEFSVPSVTCTDTTRLVLTYRVVEAYEALRVPT